MSNIEESIEELKNLVKGCCSSIKDLHLDNKEIHGQLSSVKNSG